MDREAAAALAHLADRYGLDAGQHEQLRALLEVIAGDPHAPTAVSEGIAAVEVHVADSLVALEVEDVSAAGLIADLGSGAGFPGLVLAVASPGSRVVLIESQSRKCAFIRGAIAAAGVANAEALNVRIEEWSAGAGTVDLVTARAVAAQPVVLEYAAPLLRIGGALLDWRGRRSTTEEAQSATAAAALGLRVEEVRRVIPFDSAAEHHLHRFAKVAETPARFPRRPGIARKRPLGA